MARTTGKDNNDTKDDDSEGDGGGHLGGILTLAIHNSPNNGPIDLISDKEMILHVMAVHFATYIMSVGPLLMKVQYL